MSTINELIELGLPVQTAKTLILVSFLITSLITIGAFVLKAIAIRIMAKNRGLDKLYLAWIPFFNYILLGKVIGTVFLFRKKVNNVGVLVTIFALICFVVQTLLNLGYYVYNLGEFFGFEILDYGSVFVENWMYQKGVFYTIIYYFYDVLSLIEIVIKVSLIFFVFRKYAPERAFIYSIVSIFIDPAFSILLFVIRNRKPDSFSNYTRVYVRPNYDNSYKQNGKPENDPFPEFNPNSSKNENSSNSSSSDGEDLFN